MVESTAIQEYQETPTDQVVHLIIMLEHRSDNASQALLTLSELGQLVTPEIISDPAIGKRLQQAVTKIKPEEFS